MVSQALQQAKIITCSLFLLESGDDLPKRETRFAGSALKHQPVS
jgi:hypothetical protein